MNSQSDFDAAFGVIKEEKMSLGDLQKAMDAAQEQIWGLQRSGEFRCMEWQGVVAMLHAPSSKFIKDNK